MTDVFTVGLIIVIVIAAILLINAYLGISRGFIKTFLGFFRMIIAAAAGYFLASPLASILKTTPVYKNLLSGIETSLADHLSGMNGGDISGIFSENSADLELLFQKFGRSFSDVSAEYSKLAAEQSEQATDALVKYIVTPACDAITTALSFIFIFIVVSIAVNIIIKLLDFVAKAPVLNGFNRILGLAAGVFAAFIQIFIITMLFDAAIPFIGGFADGITHDALAESSKLFGFFSSVNPLAIIIAIAVS